VRGDQLWLPLSHDLPIYTATQNLYDSLPRRLGSFLRENYGSLRCIDVGANVGDTVFAFGKGENDRFIAIEPNTKFAQYLRRNHGMDPRVKIIEALCSDSMNEASFSFGEHGGTATAIPDEMGSPCAVVTLDSLSQESTSDQVPNMVKIDTEGYDFQVMKGGKTLLKRFQPAILFECAYFDGVSDDFVADVLKTLTLIENAGYSKVIIYDNLGWLMGTMPLIRKEQIGLLLHYHLARSSLYFDILCMSDEMFTRFYPTESDFFASQIKDPIKKKNAIAAARLF
jgi:FkbM family methyltransferase